MAISLRFLDNAVLMNWVLDEVAILDVIVLYRQLSVYHSPKVCLPQNIYCKSSNIRRTKTQNLSDSRPVLQLSLLNLLKPLLSR